MGREVRGEKGWVHTATVASVPTFAITVGPFFHFAGGWKEG